MESNRRKIAIDVGSLLLRLFLALSYAFSVLDRFGYLGPPGKAGVSWGSFERFTAYVGVLNWYLPHAVIPLVARVDTAIEIFFALALIAGVWLRPVAFAGAALLAIFAVTMSMAHGINVPFSYSVPTAAAASLMLALAGSARWSIDELTTKRARLDCVTS